MANVKRWVNIEVWCQHKCDFFKNHRFCLLCLLLNTKYMAFQNLSFHLLIIWLCNLQYSSGNSLPNFGKMVGQTEYYQNTIKLCNSSTLTWVKIWHLRHLTETKGQISRSNSWILTLFSSKKYIQCISLLHMGFSTPSPPKSQNKMNSQFCDCCLYNSL